jgi:hypothetical protein
MSYLDSPISRCEAARAIVLTDQTQEDCAHEHDCPPNRICPLAGYFDGVHFNERNPQIELESKWKPGIGQH